MKLTSIGSGIPHGVLRQCPCHPPLYATFNTCQPPPLFRLTGLLSFMLSDEITTGSVNTTDADKGAWARKSHPWNIQQRKFKEAFPEACHF